MTDRQFSAFFAKALTVADREAYISDCALSSTWGDAPDADIPEERIQQLGALWDAAHTSIRGICSLTGLSQQALARRFCIPPKTLVNWVQDRVKCPDYTRLMMLQLTGLYQRPTSGN